MEKKFRHQDREINVISTNFKKTVLDCNKIKKKNILMLSQEGWTNSLHKLENEKCIHLPYDIMTYDKDK